jgi:hypothetical protein
MQMPQQTERDWRHAGRLRTFAIAATACIAVASSVLLFPADSPRAAGDDATVNSNDVPGAGSGGATNSLANGAGAEASNFGTATPTDKFVQSFQQQVSQQLQSALAQASQQQDDRLRQFEQQQKDLSEQMQAIQQSV